MSNELRNRIAAILERTLSDLEGALRETLGSEVLQIIERQSLDGLLPPAGGRGRGAAAARFTGRGVPTGELERVLQIVRANPGLRTEEIYERAGGQPRLVKKALARLRATGAVKTEGERRGTTYSAVRGATVPAARPAGRASAATARGRGARGRGKPGVKVPGRKGPAPGTKVKRISEAEIRAVLDVLNKKSNLTSLEIQKEAGISSKEAARVLLKLRKTRQVSWKGERSSARYAIA